MDCRLLCWIETSCHLQSFSDGYSPKWLAACYAGLKHGKTHGSIIFGRDFHICGAHQAMAHSFWERQEQLFHRRMLLSPKSTKSFLYKTVIPLWVSLCPKMVGNKPYFLEILGHFLASSGECNSFYASQNERTVSTVCLKNRHLSICLLLQGEVHIFAQGSCCGSERLAERLRNGFRQGWWADGRWMIEEVDWLEVGTTGFSLADVPRISTTVEEAFACVMIDGPFFVVEIFVGFSRLVSIWLMAEGQKTWMWRRSLVSL